jgi:5-methyltetrahydrofolate--homocysteine methyltransferase
VSRVLVLDGAMATLQMQTGMDAAAIHRAYLDAGADIISTDSFAGPRAKGQGPRGPRGPSDDDARHAAGIARVAAAEASRATPDQPRRVAGVIGFDLAGIDGLIEGGVDLLLAETLTSTAQVDAALAAVSRRRGAPPLMLSVAVTAAGRLPSGEPIADLGRAIDGAPLYSVGLNCGSGVDGMSGPLETLARLSTVRVSCHPAAGLPDAFGEYDEPPAVTAAFLHQAAREGLIDIAGGCCGTTPATIAAIAQALRGLPARMAGFRE